MALASAGALITLAAAPAADAAIFTFSNPAGGAINVSTNYAPAGIPGSADTLLVTALPTIDGFLTLNVAANQTVGRIELNHFAPTTIVSDVDGGNQPFTLTLSTGQLAFTDAITTAPDVALDTLLVYSPIAGGSGLTKTGPGFAFINGNNLYTGTTTISGPGGLSVTKDAALGAAGNGVTLNNGGTLRAYSSFATGRAITVDASGGRFESYGTLSLNGAIGGNGTLTVGRFTGGAVTIANAANSFSGGLVVAQSNTVNLTGRLASISSVTLGGTLNVVGSAADAINNSAGLASLGGTLNYSPGAVGDYTENIGNLSLISGTTTLHLEPTVGNGTALVVASVTRNNRSTLFVRGRDLGGGVLAPNRAILPFSNTAGFGPAIGGGGTGTTASIIPFVFGNANTTAGVSQVSVVEVGLVRLTPFGLTPLNQSNYADNPLTNAALDNVRVTNTLFTNNAARTMNALVIRDTLTSAGQSGITGTGVLSITSGAIVAVSDLSGEELLIDNAINFGAAEGIVHTAPTSDGHSQLIFNGAIAGSNGLTKSGNGELFLNGVSNYSGITTINAGTINVAGDVLANVSGGLGNSNADIIINAGVTGTQLVGLQTSAVDATISRNIVVRQSTNANSLALIGSSGGGAATFSGQITIEGGLLNLFGTVSPDSLTLSGAVIGAGGLQDPSTLAPPAQLLRITGPNSYAGGTQIRAGRWQVGSNTALGTGTVYFIGNGAVDSEQTGAIEAFGGPRSLANSIVLGSTAVFSGANALTFTGSVDLGSTAREVNVTNTADTTFAGVVGRGGLIKNGGGRLILTNANTYNGQTIVNAGVLRVANNAALGVATGPAGISQATFVTGAAAIELAGSITTGESIFLGSDASPITSGLATGNLRNVSGNNTITGQIGFDDIATIGVDAGTQLTLTGDGVDNTGTATAALRKVGAGTLAVKNVRLSTLAISTGTVRVTPGTSGLGTSRVSALSVSAGALLDLTNNALIYDYTAGSPIQAVRLALFDGRIDTSVATSGAAVGYAEASTIFAANAFPANFAGQPVDNTTVLLIQTLAGDATLDRIVDFADLVSLAQNYNLTNRVWRDGDFNYDGTVGFADLVALAQNYNLTVPTSVVADSLGSDFAADWAVAQSLVPEPSALVLLGFAALARRR